MIRPSPPERAMNQPRRTLDPRVLGHPVRGRNLRGPTLGENLSEATLLVFLRHLG